MSLPHDETNFGIGTLAGSFIADQLTLIPAALMTLPHLAESCAMRSANASGELAIENVAAGARYLSRNIGSPKIACVSALSFSTMARGVPLGAARPYQEPAWKLGRVSASAGRFGYSGRRSALPIASALSLPASMF